MNKWSFWTGRKGQRTCFYLKKTVFFRHAKKTTKKLTVFLIIYTVRWKEKKRYFYKKQLHNLSNYPFWNLLFFMPATVLLNVCSFSCCESCFFAQLLEDQENSKQIFNMAFLRKVRKEKHFRHLC